MGKKSKTAYKPKYLQWEKGEEVWDSELSVVEPQICIHPKVVGILGKFQDAVGRDEFSILFKGRWTKMGFYVSEEYMVPIQEVSGASVDFKEDLGPYKNEGFNVVAHSHPFSIGYGQFSGSDEESINVHFECSLLYTDRITDATVCLTIGEGLKLKLNCKDKVLKLA